MVRPRGAVDEELLPIQPVTATTGSPPEPPPPPPVPAAGEAARDSFQTAREEYDRTLLKAALRQAGGNLSEASRLLRISRNTLKARMRHYGLDSRALDL